MAIVAGLVLAPAALAAPANDDFANARVVGPDLPVSVPGTNVGATAEAGEPNPFGVDKAMSSVWYRWTAPSSTRVVFDVCDPDPNFGVMAIYTGSALDELTKVSETGCHVRFDAVGGTTYSVQIDGLHQQQAFTFSLRPFSPPANDNFADAQVVGPPLPIEVAGTTVDGSVEAGEGGQPGGRTVWFQWTAPASVPVRVDACEYHVASGPGNAGLFVYTGSTIPTLVPVGQSPNGCKVSFNAVSGTTYRINFDSFFEGEGNFTLRMFEETRPANDDFANAQAVGPALPISLEGTNAFSTVETGEPHHSSDNETDFPPHDSVWYRWTAAVNAEVRVRVCNSDFGARLGVYTGATVGGLTRVAPSVPVTSFPFCSLRFDVEAGTEYRIAVGGGGEEQEGSFTLDIHRFAPPSNDDFADATPIGPGLPISVQGSNVDAGAEPQEPDHSRFGDSEAFASVWYSWTATEGRMVRISTCGTGFSSLLAVYTGTLLDSLQPVATGEGGCGPLDGNQVDLMARAGTRYLIAVDGSFPQQEGPFTLRIFDPFASPPPAGTTRPTEGDRTALLAQAGAEEVPEDQAQPPPPALHPAGKA